MRIAPQGDIGYLLIVNEQKACDRKSIDSHRRQEVAQQISAYCGMADCFKLTRIYTGEEKKIREIADRIVRETLKAYYEKWHRNERLLAI
jgi:hypothetical protein